jgi:hypothetical protein
VSSVPGEGVVEPREQLGQPPQACGQQEVRLSVLRDPAAVLAGRRQPVALHDGHLPEPAGQFGGTGQPGDAAADHDRSIARERSGDASHVDLLPGRPGRR